MNAEPCSIGRELTASGRVTMARLRRSTIVVALAAALMACAGPTPGAPDATAATDSTEQATTVGRVVDGAETISGQVEGNLTVAAGGQLELLGQVTGNLYVEPGGQATVAGMVLGDVVNRGEVEVLGWVDGQVVDQGETTIVSGAVVQGSQVP